jgi:excisionase family DNA binding protein
MLAMAADIPVRDAASLPQLLSVRQLSRYLDVPVSSIYRWRHEGRGPRGFRVGKEVRFKQTDVLKWLDQQAARDTNP